MRIYNYIDKVTEMLNTANLGAMAVVGKLTEEYESIAVVLMPSSNQNFYEGQRDINLIYQVLVKTRNHKRSLQLSEQITEILLNDGNQIYSEPSFLSSDEQGCIYTSAFRKII